MNMSIGAEGNPLSIEDSTVWASLEPVNPRDPEQRADSYQNSLRNLGLGVLAFARENGQIPPDKVISTAEVLLVQSGW